MKSSITIPLDFYIPVKDGEPFIAECLESLLNQSHRPQRIVVYVNMYSKDRTLEIVKKFPVEIREVYVPLSDARNLAIQELKSEWIGCCDADVILDSQWLEHLWARRSSGAVMITGNTQERIRSVGDLFRSITSPHNWGEYDIDNPYMVVPDQIAQRQKLIEIGGYRSGLINYEDAEICARLREQGHRFYYVASARAQHWRSDDFMTSLGLRYRHSLQRQIELISSEEGLTKKMRNNFALATANLSKAILSNHQGLIELCLLLPLHHFIWDIEEAQKANVNLTSSSTENASTELILIELNRFISNEWKPLWAQLKPYFELKLTSQFLNLFEKFLRAVYSSKSLDFEFAITDELWASTLHTAIHKAKALSNIDFSKLSMMDAARINRNAQLPEAGVIYFRQPLLPQSSDFWTCRDLSTYLAKQNKKLIWTETFQGSTIICFNSNSTPFDKNCPFALRSTAASTQSH